MILDIDTRVYEQVKKLTTRILHGADRAREILKQCMNVEILETLLGERGSSLVLDDSYSSLKNQRLVLHVFT